MMDEDNQGTFIHLDFNSCMCQGTCQRNIKIMLIMIIERFDFCVA